MLCQSVKREQWMDQLKKNLLDVPYVHLTFTLPHELNSLCRMNASRMYSLLMKSSWETIKKTGKEQGFMPGMTSVLHTFGSDLKYHIHVHTLVSFGGVDKAGEWKYPKYKNRLDNYRKLCNLYRKLFLQKLQTENTKRKFTYHKNITEIIEAMKKIRWVAHSTRPTMDTQVIENYLARYINRVAISPSRIKYNRESHLVSIEYNDYKNQQKNQAAPKRINSLQPLEAIYQILQHSLPAYFQKSRHYGIHHTSNKIKKNLSIALKRKGITIRTLFEIINHLLKLNPLQCEVCGSIDFTKILLTKEKYTCQENYRYIYQKSPPQDIKIIVTQITKTVYTQSMTRPLLPKYHYCSTAKAQIETPYQLRK